MRSLAINSVVLLRPSFKTLKTTWRRVNLNKHVDYLNGLNTEQTFEYLFTPLKKVGSCLSTGRLKGAEDKVSRRWWPTVVYRRLERLRVVFEWSRSLA